MSATQKDIAQRLNLSRALVGQVLSDSPDVRVSHETRRRIVSAAREMNYRPHLAARSMKSRRSLQVGALVQNNPDNRLTHPLAWEMMLGINEGLSRSGYSMALVRLTDVREDDGLQAPIFQGHLLDGLIVVSTIPADLEERVEALVPHCVWLDANVWRPTGCVRRDEVEAGRLAAQALVDAGYRRILWPHWPRPTGGETGHYSSGQREQGMRSVAEANGATVEEFEFPWLNAQGRFPDFEARLRPDTAVLCLDVYVVQLVTCFLAQSGLAAGRDVGLASADDETGGPTHWVNVSHVSFDRFSLGLAAAEMMLRVLGEPEAAHPSILMPGDWEEGNTIFQRPS